MGFRSLLDSALDVILPRQERRRRTEVRTLSDIPLASCSHELLDTHIMTLMEYREPAVGDLIQSLKYDRSGHAALLCAGILADFLREEILSARAFSQQPFRIIPVPLHKDRLRERGFNQTNTVLQHLPSEFHDGGLASVVPALVRVRPTKQQTRLSRKERIQNVAGAFALANPHAIQNARVILIDDVVTTGATLVEAAKPLEEAGALVTLIALARA